MKDRILIISANFYPSNSSGTLRVHSFCRKFLQEGFYVDVLTVEREVDSTATCPFTEFNNLRIFRAKARDIKELVAIRNFYPSVLSIPDRNWPWFFSAVKKYSQLHSGGYRFILSSSPVQTSHLIAYYLSKKLKSPWICDFRDPWVLSKVTEGLPRYQIAIEKFLERRVVKASDIVTVTNDFYRDYLSSEYSRDVETVENGFVPGDFVDLVSRKLETTQKIFSHVGNLYGRYRDPSHLFSVIAALKDAGAINAENFLFRLIGGGGRFQSDEFLNSLELLRIKDLVEIVDRVPHRESLQYMVDSDCLVLLQCDPGLRYQVPAKFYEYLKCHRPILGLVAEGATENLLQKANPRWAVRPDDRPGIRRFILDFLAQDESLNELPSSEFIDSYSRELKAEELMMITRDRF